MPIKDHFRKVTDHGVPVSAICRKRHFRGATLSAVPPSGESLILTLPGGLSGPVETVAVGYCLDSYLYTFEARIVEAQVEQDRETTILTMDLPDRIARIERRRSPRVTCTRQAPLTIRLSLPIGEVLEASVIDIGRNGASFSLPDRLVCLRKGEVCSALITIPRLGELRADIAVRFAAGSPEGQRVGVEFLNLSEENSDLIRQYVHLRQLHIRTEQNSTAKPPSAESIFALAVEDALGGRHLIVCTDALLGHIADPGAFSEIVSVDVLDYIEKT